MLEPVSSTCKFLESVLYVLMLGYFRYNKTDVAAPFGGFKESGFGKDLGKEALNEYLKTKTITFEYNL